MRIACIVLLVSACGGDDGGAGMQEIDANVNATPHLFCVDETNRLRAGKGKPAVVHSAQLETYADSGAMIDFGGSPHQHFSSTQGGGIAFAENECPKWSLAQQGGGDMKALVGACIAAFYSEGPGGGHYENMMGNYGTLGCGIFVNGDRVTIIQDFGR
jgi:hypothetical protein